MLSVGAVTSNLNVVTKTGNYTAAPNDFVLVDATTAGVTITLPAGPPLNTLIAVKKTDASTNLVGVVPGAGANIQGDTAMGLTNRGGSATLQFDGTNWQVLSTATINAANAAAGMPTGGTAGQLLTKNSTANYDATWSASPVPAGGTAGQILQKNTATNYDVAWATPATSGPVFSRWTAGRRYTPPLGVQARIATYGLYLMPVAVPNPCTITAVSIYIWGNITTNGTGYASVYADNPAATSTGPAARIGTAGTATLVNSAFTSMTVNAVITAPQIIWVYYGISGNNTMLGHYNWPSNTHFGAITDIPNTGAVGNILYPTSASYSTASPPPADLSGVAFTGNQGGSSAAGAYPIPFFTIA